MFAISRLYEAFNATDGVRTDVVLVDTAVQELAGLVLVVDASSEPAARRVTEELSILAPPM